MKSRKSIIVDKSFQVKFAVRLSALTLTALIASLAITALFALRTTREITTEIATLQKAVDTEENIVKAFLIYAGAAGPGTGALKLSAKTVADDHAMSIGVMRDHIARLRNLTPDYVKLFAALGIFALAVAMFNFWYLIRLTHRIAGPVFVMQRHLQGLIDGTAPPLRDLRENDEFKELHATVLELSRMMDMHNQD